MGGEHSPLSVWQALIDVIVSRQDEVSDRFIFCPILTPDFLSFLDPFVAALPGRISSSLFFIVAEDVVGMKDSVFTALRKKTSSMAIGVEFLKEGKLDSLFSTGNTAALVSLACSRIPLISSISRPALLVELPTLTGNIVVLDVGANVSVKPENLLDFGKIGLAYYRYLKNNDKNISVGLLNIGTEEGKGTENHRNTFRLLQTNFGDRFFGNLESQDVFKGKVQVVVTDGFAGNIFLKTAEGVFDFLSELYVDNSHNCFIKNDLEGSVYPGSVLCGLSKLVVKGHGQSQNKALFKGISGLIERTSNRVCESVIANLELI